MHTGTGRVVELMLAGETRFARISCLEKLVPAPGQYLLSSNGPNAILPVPLFYTDSAPQGFITLAYDSWKPGQELLLRGPLGRGFSLPASARRVGLLALDGTPACLHGLIGLALKQGASIVLVSDRVMDEVPDEVEIQPLSALEEILGWADYVAADIRRENLPAARERFAKQDLVAGLRDGQVLVRTSLPCGGLAECGVCAVVTRSGWKMACKEGPVFDLREL